MLLVSKENIDKNQISDLSEKTRSISETITQALIYEENAMNSNSGNENFEGRGKAHKGKTNNKQGLGYKYTQWIQEFLPAEVSIVNLKNDEGSSIIENQSIEFSDLSKEEQDIASSAQSDGKIHYTKKDTSFFESEIVVAAPLLGSDEEPVGTVILRNKGGFYTGVTSSFLFSLALSIASGMIIVFILAIYFAHKFIKPIEKINVATKQIIKEDYNVNIGVKTGDELEGLSYNIENLARRLDASKKEAEKLEAMKDDFISSMSHELKTPVTVIKSSLEALKLGVISDASEIEEYYGILYKEATELEKLIIDLLDLNILRNPRFPMKKERNNLTEILQDAVKSQKINALEKMVDLKLDIEKPYVQIECDYSRIRQMLIAIINNAIKYSDTSGAVKVSEYSEGEATIIEVRNYGHGISEEDRDKIFVAFYRNKDTKEKGFGLGLAIAKEIALQHGIEMSVESKDNETCFKLRV